MAFPPSAPRQPARRATRRALRPARPALFYLLLVLTCGGLLLSSTTEPFIERASAVLTYQQDLSNNVFGTTALVAPGDLSARSHGHAIALSWSEGQSGAGYEVFGAGNGTSSNCSAATFTSLDSITTTSYSDSNRYDPQGTWYCYQVKTTHGEWTSQENNPSAAVQLGFVATSLQLTNGGETSACGTEQSGVVSDLDCGDQISVSFNQSVDTTTGPGNGDTVCADPSGTIWLGSTGSGDCASTETVRLGRLMGGSIENGNSRFYAHYDWNDEHTVLIVTVGALISSTIYPTLSGSPWTLIPTDDTDYLLSGSGGYHICDTNANGGSCLPEADWTPGSSLRRERLISEPTATPTPEVLITITETPNPIATLDPTETLNPVETLSPTDPAPTETPQTDEPFTTATPIPTATPTAEPSIATIEPTLEPPAATLEPTVEPPTATVEPTLKPLSTATP